MTLSEIAEWGRFLLSQVAIGSIVVGLFFLFAAAVGVLRLPDVYTRSHAVSLTDSLGALFVLSGLSLWALHQGSITNMIKILIVLILLYLLNPVIAHATVRSAHRSGLQPWSREDA